MATPRVSITGPASVCSTVPFEHPSSASQAPCLVAPGRSVLAANTVDVIFLPGPGTPLTGGILGRLGVDCQAAIDVGSDVAGRELSRLLEPATPHLRPLVRHITGVTTRLLDPQSLTAVGPIGGDPVQGCPPLPPLAETRGSIGIWAGAGACEPADPTGGFALPAALQTFEDTGLTRILSLDEPANSLMHSGTEHAWLQSCARHAEVLCVQADHLLRYLDPQAASHLLARGVLGSLPEWLHGSLLHEMANFLLELGVGAILIGLRDEGVYLRTHGDGDRVAFARRFAPDGEVAAYLASWIDREILVPLFDVPVCNRFSRTDALTAACAGGLLAGLDPADLLLSAAAVVSLASEQPNPLDGVPTWEVVQARVEGGWSQAHCHIDLSGWGEGDPHTW